MNHNRSNQYAKSRTTVAARIFPAGKMGRVRLADAKAETEKAESGNEGQPSPQPSPQGRGGVPPMQVVEINTGRGEECWVAVSGPLFLGEALRIKSVIEMGWREEKADLFARLDAAKEARRPGAT